MSTLIDGIAASENIDSSGEIISVAGMDISSLDKTGNFNWEHKKDYPMQIIGKILKAKKIFKLEDCDNERHRYFWNKCKVPYVYVMGELFTHTESGLHVAGLFQYDAEKRGINEHNVVGFSIEGAKLDKKGMTITRSIARKCTITESHCNKMAIAEKMPEMPEKTKKVDNIADFFKSEQSFKTVPYAEIELLKSDVFADVKKAEDPNHHANKLGITPMKKEMTSQAPASVDKSAAGIEKPNASIGTPKASAKTFGKTPFRDPGHTMGRTSSGKDVMSHQRIHEYRGFSTKDHEEAAKMHFEHSQGTKDHKAGAHHLDRMKLHLQAAHTSARKDDRFEAGMADKRKKLLGKAMNPSANVQKQPKNDSGEQKMEKAMTAGSGMSSPGALTDGAALAKEHLDKKMHKVDAPPPPPPPPPQSLGNTATSNGTSTINAAIGSPFGKGSMKKTDNVNKPLSDKVAGNKMSPGLKAGMGMSHMGQKVRHGAASETVYTAKEIAHKNLKRIRQMKPNLTKSEWLIRAEEEYSKWDKREQFQEFMKKRMPNMTKSEIDSFGKTMILKKSVEAEKELKKFSDAMMTGEDKECYKKPKTMEKSEKIDSEHPHTGKVISRGGEYFAKKPTGEMHHLPNKQHGKILSGKHVKFGINEHDDAVLHPRHVHELKEFDRPKTMEKSEKK